jgi:hypothetical protein
MRALPAGSFEYFGGIADGKAAVPPEPIPVVVVVSRPLGRAAFASVAGVLVGAADAVVPHSAFRNSLHVFPCTVPADCAALYLTLHSLIVRPLAESDASSSETTASVATQDVCERVSMGLSLDVDGTSPGTRCEFADPRERLTPLTGFPASSCRVPGSSQSTSRMRSSEAVSRCIALSKGVVDLPSRSMSGDWSFASALSECGRRWRLTSHVTSPLSAAAAAAQPHGRTHFCFRSHSEKRSMRRELVATDTCARLEDEAARIAFMLEAERSWDFRRYNDIKMSLYLS